MIKIIKFIKYLLVVPNLPILFLLVWIYSTTYEDDLEAQIVAIYPEWFYYTLGIVGWYGIINLFI